MESMIGLSLPSPAKLVIPPLKPLNPSRQQFSSSQSLKNPNFEPLKNRLIRLANVGHFHQAISTLELMTQSGLTPDLVTYSVLLKSCIRSRRFDIGKLIHGKLRESGLQLDSIVLNSLISLYSKCGDWVTANSIFDTMGESRDLVSWSSMISCFAHNGMESQAISTFFKMLEFGEYPNQFCFAAVIQACSNADNAWIGELIFGFVIKTGYFESDVCVGCALIDMFAKGSCNLDSAKKVFAKMPEKNAVVWTLMITRYTQLGHPKYAIDLFWEMVLSGFIPDQFTFSNVISACAELESLSLGQQLHSQVVKTGLALDVCVGCSLVDMYAKCAVDGSVDNSRKIFDRMPDHNLMSWTAIITGYVQSGGRDKEAIELYRKMIQGQVSPNHFTFSSLLKACGNLSDSDMGEQVYSQAIKLGFASVNCVGNSLISMYARSGRMEDARKAFDILFEKNLVTYNTIFYAYAKNLNSYEAFKLLHQIDDATIGIDAFTFTSLLSGAASIGAVGVGNIEAAFQVFNEMEDRNVISWTSMITGFAKHGFARRALEIFHQMLEVGMKPNEITYVAVLSACSHAGMINEGWKHFNSMYKEHGINPRMEHYACMVDLLGRSGFLEKAIHFINSMPFKPDPLVWRTLLGACQVHGNLELGKHAAKMILEQDPNDPASYILLSNL
ncbi:hypothetical protein F0562_026714 [Nyssa sinensis]|uniref:Pentacotripeptide-repeat region of PRORP domain-containing protein n=1 Tax=Nyssa sinensis TaxID=561372 RepID=A0A5J5BDQ1_9ASTE|nr:hypothetical protein F0562_026714 [Nyssa sinensis]